MSNSYPRETVEFAFPRVTVDDVVVTTGVTFALFANGTRPTTWDAPTIVDGRTGVMLTGLTPGLYRIFAKVASSPETPVIDCGYVSIT